MKRIELPKIYKLNNEIYFNGSPTKNTLDNMLKERINDNQIEEFNFENNKVSIDKLYTYDKNGNVSLKQMNPELSQKMNELVDICEKNGIPIKITESLRTAKRQDELYAQGRTVSGNIVTNAKGSDYNSFHQWGIAFDVCINDADNAYDIEKLKKVGELGKSIGLEWGGDWENFVDMPHFQLKGYENGIQELKDKYGNPGKFAESWDFTNNY